MKTRQAMLEEGLRDMVENGLRCDLNPTRPPKWWRGVETKQVEDFWQEYLARVDRSLRLRAKMLLEGRKYMTPEELAESLRPASRSR